MIYDDNLVFCENASVAGIVLAQVLGDVKDMSEKKDIGAGSAQLECYIRCTEAPVFSPALPAPAAFGFALVAANDTTLGSSPLILAHSAVIGSLETPPTVGAEFKMRISGWSGREAQGSLGTGWHNNLVYGKRYLGIIAYNYGYAFSGGATGALTAGRFTIGLAASSGDYGRIYPRSY